ncbi:MAG: stage II sporulation protein P [Bacillota bacterium]
MTRDRRRLVPLGAFLGALLVLAMVYTPLNVYNPFFRDRVERRVYTTLVNAAGEELWATTLPVYRGDELWTGPDTRYVVQRVSRRIAYLEEAPVAQFDQQPDPGQPGVALAGPGLALPLATTARTIAVYHTHSAESFVPTQGTHSVWANGGIIQVGAVFAQALEEQGFTVIHSRTPHDPHDAGAYSRSRRTALNLIRNHRPYATFDLHRDAVPARFYRTSIDGQEVSQLMLVIGRSNPLQRGNILFARRLMAVGAGLYPDLFKGLFMGRGTYNQDLDPGLLLVEAGTYLMGQPLVERGIKLLAEVVAVTAGLSGR